ncbi:MAG: hypothetical protein JO218_07900 [Burkholderiales bacterium]|nr:hypothetical protein [Burkholderiales bacterium]
MAGDDISLPASVKQAWQLRADFRERTAESLVDPTTAEHFLAANPLPDLLRLEAMLVQQGYTGASLLKKVIERLSKLSVFLDEDVGFVAGTPVWTDKGLAPIEQLKVGDVVLSKSDVTGAVAHKRVTRTFVTQDKEIFATQLSSGHDRDGESVTYYDLFFVTREHPVWAVGAGWTSIVEASNSIELNALELRDGGKCYADKTIWPVFVADSDPNVGVVLLDRGFDEMSVPVVFDSSTAVEPGFFNLRFNGATPMFTDDTQHLSELCTDDYRSYRTTVYNIEVEDFHTYFVGEIGLWAHNACDKSTESRSN